MAFDLSAAQTPVTVNIFQAKTQLSKLVEMAERGEDVIIARAGKPVARLTGLEPAKKKIVYGLLKGKIHVAEDFDDPLLPEALAEFESDL
ncbi:MAG TPA: type II toxin-antitoxin system prevent-host-death family antitoxin [Terracidiphilus sp.]|jgi:prevent-host-death family protein|nr:type II toxin-antitoxin system prevent-host-death family antitoxin [Terracidiphilus sp.]